METIVLVMSAVRSLSMCGAFEIAGGSLVFRSNWKHLLNVSTVSHRLTAAAYVMRQIG